VLVAAVVAVAALLLSNGSTTTASVGSSAAPVAGNVTIDISNFMYSPGVLTVKVGSTLTITNKDDAEHTATSDTEGVFNTGTLTQGKSMRIKLNKVQIRCPRSGRGRARKARPSRRRHALGRRATCRR